MPVDLADDNNISMLLPQRLSSVVVVFVDVFVVVAVTHFLAVHASAAASADDDFIICSHAAQINHRLYIWRTANSGSCNLHRLHNNYKTNMMIFYTYMLQINDQICVHADEFPLVRYAAIGRALWPSFGVYGRLLGFAAQKSCVHSNAANVLD